MRTERACGGGRRRSSSGMRAPPSAEAGPGTWSPLDDDLALVLRPAVAQEIHASMAGVEAAVIGRKGAERDG